MNDDARFWDKIAADYALKPWPDPQSTARKLAITRALLAPEHRLLDVGCGTGTILLELAPLVAVAEGVDVSPAMIEIARQKAASAGSKATFRAEPAEALAALPDASIDCITAYNLLHLVADPPGLIRTFARVLRPGGVLVSHTACMGGIWFPPYALVIPVMRWLGKAPLVTLFTADELRAHLAAAGFVDLQEPDVGAAAPGLFQVVRRAVV